VDHYYPSFLFHRQKFIFRNSEIPVIRFQHLSAEIYFSQQDQRLISLPASPFGAFLTDREIQKVDLHGCLDEMGAWSKPRGITELMIRMFPNEYHPRFASIITETLLESGFQIMYEDRAQYIPIKAKGSMDLNSHKKRRVRNSDTRGFQFRQLSQEALDRCYDLFVQSRVSKSYPITMSLDALRSMFALFPDQYLLFGLFDAERVIAASVAIMVSDEILYCFYLGDDLEYRTYSPVTALVSGIYDYCKVNNFLMLDLGISTDKGVVNEGLYNFKKSFGALESPKVTFIKYFE